MKILLVEDNPGDQLLFKEAIKDAEINAEIMVARSTFESLKLIYDFKPDCIVTDIGLPGMSGDDFITFIHRESRNTSNIPVVFLTGTYFYKESRNELAIGDKRYPLLRKPPSPQALKDAISKITGQRF